MTPFEKRTWAFALILVFLPAYAGAKAQSWGHLRTVHAPTAVMGARSIESDVQATLRPGDWFRIDFVGNSWAAVFDKHTARRKESLALGYVYVPLLEPFSHYMKDVWNSARDNHHDPRVSLSEEFCKLDDDYNQHTLNTIIPQLSRVQGPHVEDFPEMQRRRTIRVLTTYAPSTYFISGGQGFGFEYRLMQDFEASLNEGPSYRTLPFVVEIIPVPENLLIPSLKAGLGDVIAAGTRMTPRFAREADFTIPYLKSVSEVLVSHAGSGPILRIDDLSGRRIHVQPGWESSKTLRRINARLLVRNLPPLRPVTTKAILSSEDLLELVDEGIITLTIVESHIAHVWAGALADIRIHEFPAISEYTPLAWMVRPNNPELKARLNRFLRNRRRGSHFGNIYYRRYFKQTQWIDNPLALTDQAKFSRYVPLFRKYGARYGFDWMLLAAIAYQESEMKPDRRSRAGALGLMQVLPSTSRDDSIGIENIMDPENNVHAGTKYLAQLRDVYFSDTALPPHERIHFILAAYNAGPNRIQQCRSLAERLGYDPNRWHGQTEIAALHLIGQETVRYVANVQKFYLAYSLGHTLACLKARHMEALKADRVSEPRVPQEVARR
jgi:membrane-bound lytic murein transglycosylase MltF